MLADFFPRNIGAAEKICYNTGRLSIDRPRHMQCLNTAEIDCTYKRSQQPAPHAKLRACGMLVFTKFKTTKLNSGGLTQLVTNISTPENFPLYGIAQIGYLHLLLVY